MAYLTGRVEILRPVSDATIDGAVPVGAPTVWQALADPSEQPTVPELSAYVTSDGTGANEASVNLRHPGPTPEGQFISRAEIWAYGWTSDAFSTTVALQITGAVGMIVQTFFTNPTPNWQTDDDTAFTIPSNPSVFKAFIPIGTSTPGDVVIRSLYAKLTYAYKNPSAMM